MWCAFHNQLSYFLCDEGRGCQLRYQRSEQSAIQPVPGQFNTSRGRSRQIILSLSPEKWNRCVLQLLRLQVGVKSSSELRGEWWWAVSEIESHRLYVYAYWGCIAHRPSWVPDRCKKDIIFSKLSIITLITTAHIGTLQYRCEIDAPNFGHSLWMAIVEQPLQPPA